MGKPVVAGTSWQNITGESNNSEEPRRSQLNKDLEEIRRNALAAKRKLRGRTSAQNTRSKLEKTLGHFAATRRQFEDAVQINNTLLLNSPTNKDDQNQGHRYLFTKSENSIQKKDSIDENPVNKKSPKTFNLNGFFRAGIKGKLLTRPLTSAERFKQAVLNNDALQIFQSGNFLRPPTKKSPEASPLIKMEIAKILKEFTDSSDTDDPMSVENLKSSPVFKNKILKKRAAASKLNKTKLLNNPQKNQFLITKQITKEDKCKRRLFEEENAITNNRNSKYNNSNSQYGNNNPIRYSQRKSTPENVIFFGEYLPAKNDAANTSEKKSLKTNPTDSKLIKYYIQTCKLIAQNDLKVVLKQIAEDPVKNVKVALKTTYANAFKSFLNQQHGKKQRSQSVDFQTVSSASDIMVEPDSAIARSIKKNNRAQIDSSLNEKWMSANSSNSSTIFSGIERDFPDVEAVQNKILKRKYAASSKSGHSDLEAPSSVKVNVDLERERMTMKMDFIDPDRQELTARYLNDINVNIQQEIKYRYSDNQNNIEKEFNCQYEKQRLRKNDNNVHKTYVASKSTKHVPTILRKNRSLLDSTSEEKAVLRMDKDFECTEKIKRTLIRESSTNSHNVITERTPNCTNPTSNQAMEAPKCKYIYMNAKYNQPSRISAPVQVQKLHRNASLQKMHLFPTPRDVRQTYITLENSQISPIEKEVSFLDDFNDFQILKMSQGSSSEIQDRTNRLTLHSSQNCSQDSVDQMFSTLTNHCNSYQNSHFKTCDPPSNQVPCNTQQVAQHRGPTLQTYDVVFNPKATTCKDYQMQTLENNSFPSCALSECQVHNSHQSQSSQQHRDPLVVRMQKQNTRQPVKFIAIEGDRMPQRRPVYNGEDANSFSLAHKPSVSSQHYNQTVNSYYQSVAPEQAQYAISLIPCHSREVVKYDGVQRESNFTSECPKPNRQVMNFLPNSMSDQNFASQWTVPTQRDAHSQRFVESVHVQIPSPVYMPRVAYQRHNRPSNTKIFKVNDIYLQEVNRNARQKRP